MEYDKEFIGALGAALGVGLVIGWKVSRKYMIKKIGHAFEVAGLQGQLLQYMINSLNDDDFDPKQFEDTVNENIKFIKAVQGM